MRQNEGMATYAGYRARGMFPAPVEIDYQLLDHEHEVQRLLGEVNTLFGIVGAVSDGKLRKIAWRTGVTRRGSCVVGATMARAIDTRLCTDRLLETATQGPTASVACYNSLVDAAQRVQVPDERDIAPRKPAARSLVRRLLQW